MYWILDSEVATEFGEGTEIDSSQHPPTITKLSVGFQGWLGDDLLAMFPCFLVTDRLKDAIERSRFSGCTFSDVDVSRSVEFDELYPDRTLPDFAWMKVHGKAGREDFGLDAKYRLVVSENVLNLLRSFRIENCDVLPWPENAWPLLM